MVIPLVIFLLTLMAADVGTTEIGLRAGLLEANPFYTRGLPLHVLYALKIVVGASYIALAVLVTHPVLLPAMLVVTVVYIIVVARNTMLVILVKKGVITAATPRHGDTRPCAGS